MIILDTDILSIVLRDNSDMSLRIRARIAQLPADEKAATTIVTYDEQTRGWQVYLSKARTKSKLVFAYAMLNKHLDDFRAVRVIPFDSAAADRFEQLRRDHPRLGAMDLRIAAIALVRNATLVTRNLVDFEKISGLHAEDWTKP